MSLVIHSLVKLFLFEIHFEYDTQRNNHKTNVCQIKASCEEDAYDWFWMFIERKNRKKCKAYANVNILACEKKKCLIYEEKHGGLFLFGEKQ